MRITQYTIKRHETPVLGREKKCMNCGRIITQPTVDLYSRRFCSLECKEEYCRK